MADRVVLTPSVLTADLVTPALMLTRKGGTGSMTAVPRDPRLRFRCFSST